MPKPPKERALRLKMAIDLFSFEKTRTTKMYQRDIDFLHTSSVSVLFPDGNCWTNWRTFSRRHVWSSADSVLTYVRLID